MHGIPKAWNRLLGVVIGPDCGCFDPGFPEAAIWVSDHAFSTYAVAGAALADHRGLPLGAPVCASLAIEAAKEIIRNREEPIRGTKRGGFGGAFDSGFVWKSSGRRNRLPYTPAI
jgi:hypothetical protein